MLHTIIVCTADRLSQLEACLPRVADALAFPSQTEVLLIDNGPSDQTSAIGSIAKAAFGERIANLRVERSRSGLSSARNHGLDVAKGDVISFLDDDAYPVTSDWQSTIWSVFRSVADVGIVGGPTVWAPSSPEFERPWWRSARTDSLVSCRDFRTAGYVGEEDIWGLNASYRKAAIGEVRFDEALGWHFRRKFALPGEDTTFNDAIAAKGWKAWADPKVAVKHRIDGPRLFARWYLRRAFVGGQYDVIYSATHGQRVGPLYAMALAGVVLGMFKVAIRAVQGRWDRSFANLCNIAGDAGRLTVALRHPGRSGGTPSPSRVTKSA